MRLAKQLYARSLGPWSAVEVMSVDWMRALAVSFAVHFPKFAHEPYFEDCFKRDYVRVRPIPDAATALTLVDSRME